MAHMTIDPPNLTEREQLDILLGYSWTNLDDKSMAGEAIMRSALIAGVDKQFAKYPVRQRVIAYAINAFYWPPQRLMADRLKLHFAIFKYADRRNEKEFYKLAVKTLHRE
jgi:hypothetical protein